MARSCALKLLRHARDFGRGLGFLSPPQKRLNLRLAHQTVHNISGQLRHLGLEKITTLSATAEHPISCRSTDGFNIPADWARS